MASGHEAVLQAGSQQLVDADRTKLVTVLSDSTLVEATRLQDGGSSSDTTDYHTDEDKAGAAEAVLSLTHPLTN